MPAGIDPLDFDLNQNARQIRYAARHLAQLGGRDQPSRDDATLALAIWRAYLTRSEFEREGEPPLRPVPREVTDEERAFASWWYGWLPSP